MFLLLFNSLIRQYAALCYCCSVEKEQKADGQSRVDTEQYLACTELE